MMSIEVSLTSDAFCIYAIKVEVETLVTEGKLALAFKRWYRDKNVPSNHLVRGNDFNLCGSSKMCKLSIYSTIRDPLIPYTQNYDIIVSSSLKQ